ncbi:hypothetical protein ACWEQ1_35580 [Streptomyces nodosus]
MVDVYAWAPCARPERLDVRLRGRQVARAHTTWKTIKVGRS